MDTSAVKSYMQSVNADYEMMNNRLTAMWLNNILALPFRIQEWTTTYFGWKGWYNGHISDAWLDADDYNQTRVWAAKLENFRSQLTEQERAGIPTSPIPPPEKSVLDKAGDAAEKSSGSFGFGIGAAIALAGIGYLVVKGRR